MMSRVVDLGNRKAVTSRLSSKYWDGMEYRIEQLHLLANLNASLIEHCPLTGHRYGRQHGKIGTLWHPDMPLCHKRGIPASESSRVPDLNPPGVCHPAPSNRTSLCRSRPLLGTINRVCAHSAATEDPRPRFVSLCSTETDELITDRELKFS